MNKYIRLIPILLIILLSSSIHSVSANQAEILIPEILDQSQNDVDYGFWFDLSMVRWQEFIPTVDNISQVSIYIQKYGSPGNIIVELRDQTGVSLLDSDILVEGMMPGSGWINASFSYSITPGEKYRIYVKSDIPAPSVDDRYAWMGSTASEYCPKCDNDVNSSWPDYDYAFRTFGYGVRRFTVADFDSDRSTDISVYRPSNGNWYVYGEAPIWWGMPGDIPVPGNYDGCGDVDIAVYRPSNGKWYVNGMPAVWWGMPGDVPVPGDYDGDGITEKAVYRPSNGKWYIYGESPVWWGLPGDIPIQRDFDGDFATEIAVYRPSNGKWYVMGESPIWWGISGDVPVPADYDGDGLADIAVYRPSNGKWYIYGESPVWWGMPGDIPVPGDYDGCGDTEIAIYRPSNGKWYIYGEDPVWWGFSDDYPLPVSDTNGDGDPYH